MWTKRNRVDPREKRVVNRLRRASGLADMVISTGLFGLIAQWSLDYPAEFNGFNFGSLQSSIVDVFDGTMDFAVREWPGLILALALYLWFWSYRTHTNNEIEILESLYPEGKAPSEWEKVTNRKIIHVLALGIVTVFMLMAALLHLPALFALVMICMWCQDMFGNEILRDNLRRIFAEHDPALSPDDPTTTLFKMRQSAARHYWLELPQLRRIVFMMIVTIAALATSVAFHLHKEQLACWGYNVDALTAVVDTSVQLVLAGIILANEAVMQNWRNKRDAALLDAEIVFADSQEASAKATTNTQAPPTPDVPPPAANVSAPTDQTVDGTDKGAGD